MYGRIVSTLIISSILASAAVSARADENSDVGASNEIEEISVIGVRKRLYEAGMLKDVIQKTEVISSHSIEQSQAANLVEAIAEAPGVRVNNECSMCGVKRVMLNGLRGEHTTILVDGVPTYTMMSGFYGLDAAASAGVDSIEIARGAGASMIAPEAIGGTINLVTIEASENAADFDISAGETGYRKASLVATGITQGEATKATFIAQYDNRDQYDGDDNGVSENPELENMSLTLRVSQDFGANDNVVVRLNRTESEIFGGPMDNDIDTVLQDYNANPDFESVDLFVDGDVRNQYIGRAWETTEWIESKRIETSVNWLHEFNSRLNASFTGSYNQHEQDSFYEGFRYDADNDMTYLDARFNWAINADHLLTFGVDSRMEDLRSTTNSDSPAYVSDSFDYDTLGFYVQDTWTVTDSLEISMALRIDKIEADFIDPAKAGVEIDETILSPRIDMLYSHSDTLTSRLSFGRGYRAPLSFFESDHGILDGDLGFDINVEELERSYSGSYALSYEWDRLSMTGSLTYTNVENLAALDETETGVPVLAQLESDANVFVADVAMNYQLTDHLGLSGTFESINYNDEFKLSYGVVPVETRLTLSADWDFNGWDVFVATAWVGDRDLSEYGTPVAPTFDANGTEAKSQEADSYWVVDFRVSKEINDRLQVYAGASNLLNYTQVNDMETPLFYEDGGYDVAHIYGPLRGREAYAGVKFSF